MSNTSTSNDKTVGDDAKVKLIIGEIGRDTKTGIIGRGYSFDNGNTFHVTDTIFGRLYDDRDADGIWNNGMHEKVKEKVNQEITNTVEPAIKQADSAVAYANDAIEKSRVNQQAIVEINSAVSDAVSDAAVARSDGLRAWDAAQSNVDLIDQNYASASAAISSARTEAIAAADEAKKSASAAQADIVAVRSDVAAVQADVTANKSDVAAARSDIAIAKTDLASQATSLSSYALQASAAGQDITVLKSQAGQLEQDMADTKGDVIQLKVSASSASAALSDAAGNISSLQASAKSYSAALSDTNSNVATVTATASELETKYADAAGDINKLQTDAKGMTQTISNAQGDIAKLKIRADGFDTQFSSTNGNINKLQTDATGTKQTLTNAKSDIAVLQTRADGFDTKFADTAGDINTLQVDASGMKQTLTDAKGDISTLQATATGFKNTLTDAQGNISTLQSDVSGLKKTTSDHAGNIATLQADAKTLTSQMADAQGNISTLQQTASGFSSKVSGMETSLANANSKVDAIQANGGGRNLLFGTSGDWITKTASGWMNVTTAKSNKTSVADYHAGDSFTYSATVTNKSNSDVRLEMFCCDKNGNRLNGDYYHALSDYVAPNTNAKRISCTITIDSNTWYVEHTLIADGGTSTSKTVQIKGEMFEYGMIAHDWQPAPEDVDAKITTNSTAIDQNKKAIALKADQTTVDKTNGDVQQLQSQLKVQADQINAKVSSSDLPNLVGKGGRNLWIDSKSFQQCDINVQPVNWNTDSDGITTAHITGTGGFYGRWQNIYANRTEPFAIGDSETFSVEMKGTGTITIGREYDFVKAVTLTNTWTRYSVSGEVKGANRAHIMYNESGKDCDIYVRLPMVEHGIIAHDWQPAPEDAQTYTQTQIKQTADSWNANLTSVKDGLTDKYTNLHATVDGIQAQVYNSDGSSKITQLSNLIATKVSSTDFTALNDRTMQNRGTVNAPDFNSLTQAGYYTITAPYQGKNYPTGNWGTLEVSGQVTDVNGRLNQKYVSDNNGTVYTRQYNNNTKGWTAWSKGATESEIIQLSDDINIRVKKGDVVSQINQEAGGNTLIQVANGQGKLALNASSVIFSGSAFIPDAYISTLNADKLRFYDSFGNVATMSAGLEQYDDDKANKTIVLQYAGGYEVHASDLLSSILTMHDNTIRLAVKANGMASSGNVDQYSGFYASQHYAQLSCYRSDGKAPGIFIKDDDFTIKGDESGNGTKYGDLYIVSPQIHVRGSNVAQMQVNKTHAWLSDGMLHLYKDGDGGSTATQLRVDGWAWINGWVEAAGHSQHSALSTKTDIQSVDDDKMLKMVNDTDLATFLYKTDVANGETHRHIGLIIDDVHDVAQYQTPQDFIAPNGVSRDDDNMIGALFGAVKALTKKIKTLESKVG
ncbi:tail fiber domain-containing protein [Limosilactobacillus mucosae]